MFNFAININSSCTFGRLQQAFNEYKNQKFPIIQYFPLVSMLYPTSIAELSLFISAQDSNIELSAEQKAHLIALLDAIDSAFPDIASLEHRLAEHCRATTVSFADTLARLSTQITRPAMALATISPIAIIPPAPIRLPESGERHFETLLRTNPWAAEFNAQFRPQAPLYPRQQQASAPASTSRPFAAASDAARLEDPYSLRMQGLDSVMRSIEAELNAEQIDTFRDSYRQALAKPYDIDRKDLALLAAAPTLKAKQMLIEKLGIDLSSELQAYCDWLSATAKPWSYFTLGLIFSNQLQNACKQLLDNTAEAIACLALVPVDSALRDEAQFHLAHNRALAGDISGLHADSAAGSTWANVHATAIQALSRTNPAPTMHP